MYFESGKGQNCAVRSANAWVPHYSFKKQKVIGKLDEGKIYRKKVRADESFGLELLGFQGREMFLVFAESFSFELMTLKYKLSELQNPQITMSSQSLILSSL